MRNVVEMAIAPDFESVIAFTWFGRKSLLITYLQGAGSQKKQFQNILVIKIPFIYYYCFLNHLVFIYIINIYIFIKFLFIFIIIIYIIIIVLKAGVPGFREIILCLFMKKKKNYSLHEKNSFLWFYETLFIYEIHMKIS